MRIKLSFLLKTLAAHSSPIGNIQLLLKVPRDASLMGVLRIPNLLLCRLRAHRQNLAQNYGI